MAYIILLETIGLTCVLGYCRSPYRNYNETLEITPEITFVATVILSTHKPFQKNCYVTRAMICALKGSQWYLFTISKHKTQKFNLQFISQKDLQFLGL